MALSSLSLLVMLIIPILSAIRPCASSSSFPDAEGDDGGGGGGGDDEDEELFEQGKYYTMHMEESQVTLKIRLDGGIEWDQGTPTLYSVFHEHVLHERDSGERMYTLEATASQHWICMTGKGRLYTRRQPPFYHFKRNGDIDKITEFGRIRHPHKKSEGGPRRRRRPPSDCLFKTFEFSKSYESYEHPVGIYSYPHSNLTHGRFLSISPRGSARTYRRAFGNLGNFSPVKITQLPIRYLRDMVKVTKFGRGPDYNGRVRRCILHHLSCPNHRRKIRRGRWARRKQHHFFKIIERCKGNVLLGGGGGKVTTKPPRCNNSKGRKNKRGGGGNDDDLI